jgi:hypothetical protein
MAFIVAVMATSSGVVSGGRDGSGSVFRLGTVAASRMADEGGA